MVRKSTPFTWYHNHRAFLVGQILLLYCAGYIFHSPTSQALGPIVVGRYHSTAGISASFIDASSAKCLLILVMASLRISCRVMCAFALQLPAYGEQCGYEDYRVTFLAYISMGLTNYVLARAPRRLQALIIMP